MFHDEIKMTLQVQFEKTLNSSEKNMDSSTFSLGHSAAPRNIADAF